MRISDWSSDVCSSDLGLRFVTGACMAGIYPVGMRLAAGWARGDIGLLVGLLVGALTLGSASPHLFLALGGLDWRPTRSEEHPSERPSLMRISSAVFCMKKKNTNTITQLQTDQNE